MAFSFASLLPLLCGAAIAGAASPAAAQPAPAPGPTADTTPVTPGVTPDAAPGIPDAHAPSPPARGPSATVDPFMAPAPTHAQPLAPGCGLRIVRAPDELRASVGRMLVADAAACGGRLDVWLLLSDGGIYVQARDRLGRIRERVVPDEASAATLIASWVEVDAAAPLWPEGPGAMAEVSPGLVAAVAAGSGAKAAPPPRRSSLGVDAAGQLTMSVLGWFGPAVHVGLDGTAGRRARVGAAFEASWLSREDGEGSTNRRRIYEIYAYIQRPYRSGGVVVTPELSLGYGVTRDSNEFYDESADGSVMQRLGGGVRLAYPARRGFHFEAGAALTGRMFIDEDFAFDALASVFAGLRFQR